MNGPIIFITSSYVHHHYLDDNKGGEAAFVALVTILRDTISDAEIITNIQLQNTAWADTIDLKRLKTKVFSIKHHSFCTTISSSVDLIRAYTWWLAKSYLKTDVQSLINNRKLKAYASADIILYLVMDNLVDGFGTTDIIEHCKDMLLGILLKRKTLIYAASMGPISNKPMSWLVKKTLQKLTAISARETRTIEWLETMEINRQPIYLIADPAILLEAKDETANNAGAASTIMKSRTYKIGLVIPDKFHWTDNNGLKKYSLPRRLFKITEFFLPEALVLKITQLLKRHDIYQVANKFDEPLVVDMVKLIDYLTSEFEADVLLMTHVDESSYFSDPREDVKAIYSRVKEAPMVHVIPSSCSAAEHKFIIGECAMIISGKMHASIAALSQSIPVIAIPYGTKFTGMMELYKQEKYICRRKNIDELIEMVKEVWNKKASICAELNEIAPDVEKQAFFGATVIRKIIDDE